MELFRALAVLVEPPDRPGVARVAEALGLGELPEASAYTDLFVFQLYPYASVYVGAEGMLGGEARDRVAGFLAALGRDVPAEPDHLALLLGAYAGLAEAEGASPGGRRESLRRARRALLWEHLLSWLPVYLDKVERVAPHFYRRWAEMLRAALDAEAETLGAPETLPLHLREAPAVADPREAAPEEFLKSLLAPARSGLVLVRDDLARAAREIGTGVRAGERLFALRSLMGQDAAGTLSWLAREADAWHALHRQRRAAHGAVAGWWAERAASTARLLRALSVDDAAQDSEDAGRGRREGA
ncbi:MAG: molecular chaperone TorD family protein [Acidobacteria bacterium]|nr:molecular chaperone TorD family protein [Acidobacteriota bacterium]MBV9923646.1 molecular chaperone TorD family protein [Acidobacteriota bacterium]